MKPFSSPEYFLPDVRLYGGFVSHLPPALEEPRQRLVALQRNGSPYETAVVRKEMLLGSVLRASDATTWSVPLPVAARDCVSVV